MHVTRFLSVLLLLFLTSPLAQAQPESDLERIRQATVYIMQLRLDGAAPVITCTGSGTVVGRDGLILTNAHFTQANATCPGDALIVAFTLQGGQAPVPRFRAEVVQVDAGLDLALLRITRQLDGRLLEPGSLALPFVEPGDSDVLALDDTISIVGFPDIADDPVDLRRGSIISFTQEPGASSPYWIHLLADIPGTMTGGGAYNQAGQLVGIPTTAPLQAGNVSGNCAALQDSNRDGLLNRDDSCIPRGSAINSLRPVSFALPLLRAASLGLSVELPKQAASMLRAEDAPVLERLFFAPAVNEAGMPNTVVGRLAAGSNGLYLFFDYRNMTPETILELRVTTDGIPNPGFSLAPVRWRGGERGLWYIGSRNQPWPNGVYDFALFTDGRAAGSARLVIGGGADPVPTFSDLVFGIVDSRGTPLGNGFVLPAGSIANARFIYRNMRAGTTWTVVWYYNGREIARTEDQWAAQDGESGAKTIQIEDPAGLPPGIWRLELYIDGKLSSTSDFVIAGAQQGVFPQIFDNARFSTGDSSGISGSQTLRRQSGAEAGMLNGSFDWQQIAPGTPWRLRLLVDDEPFFDRSFPWTNPDSGRDYSAQIRSAGAIPDGTWGMQLLINNVLLASTETQVGIGRLFIDRFASAEGLRLRGRIIDGQNGVGLPGVNFVLITEDYSIADFEWRQDQIFATAQTDRNGNFEVERLLQRNTLYSVIINAEGWLPLAADAYTFDDGAPNPVELIIPLTRDR